MPDDRPIKSRLSARIEPSFEQLLFQQAREELAARARSTSLSRTVADSIRRSRVHAAAADLWPHASIVKHRAPARSWGLALAAILAIGLIPLAQWKLAEPLIRRGDSATQADLPRSGGNRFASLLEPMVSPLMARLENPMRIQSQAILTVTEEVARNVVERLPGDVVTWHQIKQIMPMPKGPTEPTDHRDGDSKIPPQRGAGSASNLPTASSTDAFRTSA